ncbi:hypothetical protein ACFL2B_00450 [Patescibacteria group bacterium]
MKSKKQVFGLVIGVALILAVIGTGCAQQAPPVPAGEFPIPTPTPSASNYDEPLDRGTSTSPVPTATPASKTSPALEDLASMATGEEGEASQVVLDFLNASLGTLPGAAVNEAMAKSYLADNLASQYSSAAFIPQTLCIQDGPSEVRVSNEVLFQNAEVYVEANYGGEWQEMWQFVLADEGGEWKISNIFCLQR